MAQEKPNITLPPSDHSNDSSFNQSETIQADSDIILPTPLDADETQGLLVVMAGKNIGRAYPLSQAEVKIGRENSSEIYIGDNTVSRNHAIIRYRANNEYWVEDLGSKAGTFINGRRLDQPRLLNDGDNLQIGTSTVFKLIYPSLRSAGAPLAQQQEDLRRELEAARRVQLEMVPPARKVLKTPLALITGIVKPASFTAGDFWTYVDTPSRLFLLVADVTGHGAGPAMLTTVAKSCLDTVLLRPSESLPLEEVLGTMNQVILNISKGNMAMTAFAALIDPVREVVSYVSAGHVPQLLLRRDGDRTIITPLAGVSSPLGEQTQVDLAFGEEPHRSGDRLVLFTDGLVESCDTSGNMFNVRRLRRFLASHSHLPLSELLEAILAEVEPHEASRPAEDDITLVLAELR